MGYTSEGTFSHVVTHLFFITGLPAVITLTAYVPDRTVDEVPIPEACRRLEEAGAAVVGINCGRGPSSMVSLLKEIKKACKVGNKINFG